jgi:YVTN family beta-propeller protein
MRPSTLTTIVLAAIALLQVASCVHKPYVAPVVADGNFPPDVARILVSKCAVSGCHNAASYVNAGNLRLDSWEATFDGSNNGAVVVPYSPAYSPLLYYVNTDSSLGTVAVPTMPQSTSAMPQSPLSRSEYETLVKWITNGAPDRSGNIAFSADAGTRQKIYITQQGCDLMAVIDAQKHVVMRYIPIGAVSSRTESPHIVKVASDGAFAYAGFLYGNYVQKIDTRTDQVVAAANVGSLKPNAAWNILHLSQQDTAMVITDWEGDGGFGYVTTGNMSVVPSRSIIGGSLFMYPHAVTSVPTFDTFFITAQYGNVVYKLSMDGLLYKQLSLNGATPVTSTDTSLLAPNPHDILMLPGNDRYMVTCQGNNSVVVMDAHADTIVATIPVGRYPQELAISATVPYVFVTCMEDATPVAGMKGSVYAINYNTWRTTPVYGDFYQPHGIAVDDRNGLLYVVSTNANPSGPAPHHATACSGRAGWYSIIDLNTLTPFNNKRYQLTVLPYSAAVRFR